MASFTLRAMLLATLIALASCATFGPKLETPTISLMSLQMTSGDMFSQLFKARVKVENPNDIAVPVENIEYKVFLMGDRFGEGTTDQAFVLPARGEAEFDMMLTTDFVSALGRLVSRMGGNKLENVEYEVTGKLHLREGTGADHPVQSQGPAERREAAEEQGATDGDSPVVETPGKPENQGTFPLTSYESRGMSPDPCPLFPISGLRFTQRS